MRILYLAHRVPFPPNKGEKIRASNVLRHLAQRHEVWFAGYLDDPADEQHLPELYSCCHRAVVIRLNRRAALMRGARSLLRGHTLTEGFYDHSAMRATLADWSAATRFDVVVAFSSSMAPYALAVPAARRVLDLCDLDSRKWMEYAQRSRGPLRHPYAVEGRRLAAREERWIRSFDASILISAAEASLIADSRLRRRVRIVTGGAALPAWVPDRVPDSPVVGFVGDLGYAPNVDGLTWFIRHIWPGVRAAVPAVRLHLVGRRPVRRIRALARLAEVRLEADVPDVSEHLARFQVSIAPLRIARGLQNKVLEAMAWAKPLVLTTPAATGIGGEDGRHYLVADDPAEFATRVVRCLKDAGLRLQLGRQAREFVRRRFDWPRQLEEFERVVTGACDGMARTEDAATTAESACEVHA